MIWFLLVVPVILVLLRRQLRRRVAARQSTEITAGLAKTIDLIVVVLGSGGTVHEALSVIATVAPVPVRPAFVEVLRQSSDGLLLSNALAFAYDLLTPEFHPLLGALLSAERDGGAMSAVLERLADDAEQARKWQAEAVARRLSVSLLLPLVVCLLPAVVIGALVPLVVVTVRQLGV